MGNERCRVCNGTGHICDGISFPECPSCGGTGYINEIELEEVEE